MATLAEELLKNLTEAMADPAKADAAIRERQKAFTPLPGKPIPPPALNPDGTEKT